MFYPRNLVDSKKLHCFIISPKIHAGMSEIPVQKLIYAPAGGYLEGRSLLLQPGVCVNASGFLKGHKDPGGLSPSILRRLCCHRREIQRSWISLKLSGI